MVEFLSFNLVPLFFLVDNLLFVSRNYLALVNPRLKREIRTLNYGLFIHRVFGRRFFIFAEIVLLNVDCVDQLSRLFHELEFLGGITPFTVFMEIASPCFQAEVRCTGDLWYAVQRVIQVICVNQSSFIMRIHVLNFVQQNSCPNTLGLLLKIEMKPVFAAISKECTILHGVHLIGDEEKDVFVELEVLWELKHYLSKTVEILQEYWRPLTLLVVRVIEPESEVELVTKRDPIFADQGNETLNRSIIWVHHMLGKSTKLSSTIPTIRAMD